MNRKIIDFLFIWSGTKFFFDWLLYSNPVSKNPLIRQLIIFDPEQTRKYKSAYNLFGRIRFAKIAFGIHLLSFMGLWWYIEANQLGPIHAFNILCNLYPCFVQLYIGYRCFIVQEHRKSKIIHWAPAYLWKNPLTSQK